ncbi:MAG TPA: 3-oxoadipate enol-lactonase [Beijerinckiaceae bacterium]|jgi:3-oxoadipate enol-lactonase
MTFVEAPGARLFTRVDGAEGAPWLVLSNSLAADHTMWEPQIPLLSSRYRVLRYDTRGHGRSDAPEGPYTLSLLVDDVVRILDHYGIGKTSFMGLSLGGMTGLGLAIGHGDRLDRLVCCDTRADAPEPYVKGWDERLAVVERDGLRGILQGTVERWLAPSFRAAHPEVVASVERMILATPVEGYKACAEAIKRLDYLKDLARIAVPTLFVVGAQDMGAPPDVMRRMAEAVPSAKLVTIPDAAHLPNLDNTLAFNEAIAGFLGLR